MSAEWFFIVAVIVAGILFLLTYFIPMFKHNRNVARFEFAEYVRKYHPDINLQEVGPKAIVASINGQTRTLRPQAVYLAQSTINLDDEMEKKRSIRKVC